MNAYLDASVVLRFVLEQPGRLRGLDRFDSLVTCSLTQTECLRSVDNARLRAGMPQEEFVARRRAVHVKLRGIERIVVDRRVLGRAEDVLPAIVGTLDAIHLAAALAWRDRRDADLVLATHDRQLGHVAGMFGLEVIGT